MAETITVACGKCNGKGEIKAYSNIAGGICFACGGKGAFTYNLKQYESRQEKKRQAAEKKLVEQEQRRREYADTLYTFAQLYKDHPEFIRCMASCPSEEHYEIHLYNTMRFMQAQVL